MPTLKVRDMIREVESLGWVLVGYTGSHRQFKHPTLRGRVTIPGHPNDDLRQGTVRSIRKQAQGNPPGGGS